MAPSEVIITVFFLTWGWGSPPPPVLYHLNPDAKAIMKGDLHLPKRQSKGPRGFLTVKKAGKGHDQSHQSASRLFDETPHTPRVCACTPSSSTDVVVDLLRAHE
jgi:hypothetical protein